MGVSTIAGEEWVFFAAGEAANGQTDYNNGGDQSDTVVHWLEFTGKKP